VDRYSRTVAFLKVLLPLLALAILATVFLLSRTDGPNANIPFAEGDITERVRDQRITRPFFSGVTDKGEEITVDADAARPGTADRPGGADNIRATIKMTGGTSILLESDSGAIDPTGDVVMLTGDVRITSSTGLHVQTEALNAALSGVRADTPGRVTGTGPMGRFTAGRMEIGAKSDDEDVHMLFKDGVNLIYEPQKLKDN
jgi:lipopolysaccharide export system protein LptC